MVVVGFGLLLTTREMVGLALHWADAALLFVEKGWVSW